MKNIIQKFPPYISEIDGHFWDENSICVHKGFDDSTIIARYINEYEYGFYITKFKK